MTSGDRGLLRTRGEHEHGKVTFVELFFDLVFVFAVTQLSHLLARSISRSDGCRARPRCC